MIESNYSIKDISQSRPPRTRSIGKIRGLKSYFSAAQPHTFILEASGKYYTIEYNNNAPTEGKISEYDELTEFVETIKPFLVWDLITI